MCDICIMIGFGLGNSLKGTSRYTSVNPILFQKGIFPYTEVLNVLPRFELIICLDSTWESPNGKIQRHEW